MSLKSGHGGSQDEGRPDSAGGGGEDETVVDDQQGNVLSHIISQLRPGADLSRVTLPTFILEPRSMLERITNFMAHPENLLPIPEIDDPVARFVAVIKFYLSGWHIRPTGVKKPLNPILGEVFTGWWDFEDGTKAYYISEQTSHHPPKSSYYYAVPHHHIRVDGTLKPRSKFLGNSVGSFMEGVAILRFTNRTDVAKTGERYFITQPNMYARGILFGKMKMELGDHVKINCPETHLVADIEFKTKGWVGGGYNMIGGTIKNEQTGQVLYELSGNWTQEMFITDHHSKKKDLLFDATHAKHQPPKARAVEEQHERESQRLWAATTKAIKEVNHEVATDSKTAIEEQQRAEAAQRHETGQEWQPKLFRAVPPSLEPGEDNLDWIIDADINASNPDDIVKQILAIYPILPGQTGGDSQTSKSAQSQEPVKQPSHPVSQGENNGQAPEVAAADETGASTPKASAPSTQAGAPSAQSHTPAVTQTTALASSSQHELPIRSQQLAGQGDVIDFEDSKTAAEAAAAAVEGNYEKLVQLQAGSVKTTAEKGRLERLDTETGERDEFVDAQG